MKLTEQEREAIRSTLNHKKILVVPYAHSDYAAIHTRKWHQSRFTEIILDILAIMERHPDFRWYFDCFTSQLSAFVERHPEKIQQLRQLIAEGKIAICGTFANIRPNMVGEETYIRNILLGRKKFKELFPEADFSVYAQEVDVALGHPQVPQIMQQFGYELYRCYRPCEVMDAKNLPNEFIWEGLDGSQLMVSRGDYAGFCYRETSDILQSPNRDARFDYVYENIKIFLNACKTDILWVSCGGDDCFPFHAIIHSTARSDDLAAAIDVPEIIKQWNKEETSSMQFATPVEFLQQLKPLRQQLPVVKGTIDPCDVSYNICLNGEKGLWAKRLEGDREIANAQKWASIAQAAGLSKGTYDFDALWQTVILCSSHASQWLFEQDYEAFLSRIGHAIYEAKTIQQQILQELADKIQTKTNTVSVVFNSTPFERTEYITLRTPCVDPEQLELRDGLDRTVPFQVIKTFDFFNTWEYELLALVTLPPMGYTAIHAHRGDISARFGKEITAKKISRPTKIQPNQPIVFEAGDLVLQLTNGHLLDIVSNVSGTHLTATQERAWNQISYYDYDYKGTWEEGTRYEKATVTWKKYQVIETGPLRYILRLWGAVHNHSITQDIIVLRGKEEIHFTCTADWKPCNGYLTASIPVSSGQDIIGDIPFGQETKNMEYEYSAQIIGPQNFHRKRDGVYFAKQFSYVVEDSVRLAFCRINTDRYFIYDKQNKTMGNILINSIIRTKGSWEEDINPYVEGAGRHCFQYAFTFEQILDNTESMHKKSSCFIDRPVVIDPNHHARNGEKLLPRHHSFVHLQSDNCSISNIFQQDGVVQIRLWETEGKGGPVRLTLPFCCNLAQLETLSGNIYQTRTVTVHGQQLTFDIKPWEILVLRCTVHQDRME